MLAINILSVHDARSEKHQVYAICYNQSESLTRYSASWLLNGFSPS